MEVFPEEGDLVQAVHAVGHDDVVEVHLRHHVGHHVDQFRFIDADGMVPGPCRVDERADDREEDRLDAELVFGAEYLEHDRVKIRGVDEADPDVFDQPGRLLRRPVDIDAQSLQNIRAARRRRDGPAAVFGHRYAGRGREDRVCGADIEGCQPASGPAGIRQLRFNGDLHGNAVPAHGLSDVGHFLDAGPLAEQADQETGDLHVGQLSGIDGVDNAVDFASFQIEILRQLGKNRLDRLLAVLDRQRPSPPRIAGRSFLGAPVASSLEFVGLEGHHRPRRQNTFRVLHLFRNDVGKRFIFPDLDLGHEVVLAR